MPSLMFAHPLVLEEFKHTLKKLRFIIQNYIQRDIHLHLFCCKTNTVFFVTHGSCHCIPIYFMLYICVGGALFSLLKELWIAGNKKISAECSKKLRCSRYFQ